MINWFKIRWFKTSLFYTYISVNMLFCYEALLATPTRNKNADCLIYRPYVDVVMQTKSQMTSCSRYSWFVTSNQILGITTTSNNNTNIRSKYRRSWSRLHDCIEWENGVTITEILIESKRRRRKRSTEPPALLQGTSETPTGTTGGWGWWRRATINGSIVRDESFHYYYCYYYYCSIIHHHQFRSPKYEETTTRSSGFEWVYLWNWSDREQW